MLDYDPDMVCPECKHFIRKEDWLPFCSEDCWELFDDGMRQDQN